MVRKRCSSDGHSAWLACALNVKSRSFDGPTTNTAKLCRAHRAVLTWGQGQG